MIKPTMNCTFDSVQASRKRKAENVFLMAVLAVLTVLFVFTTHNVAAQDTEPRTSAGPPQDTDDGETHDTAGFSPAFTFGAWATRTST